MGSWARAGGRCTGGRAGGVRTRARACFVGALADGCALARMLRQSVALARGGCREKTLETRSPDGSPPDGPRDRICESARQILQGASLQ